MPGTVLSLRHTHSSNLAVVGIIIPNFLMWMLRLREVWLGVSLWEIESQARVSGL